MPDLVFSRATFGNLIDSWFTQNTPVYGILTNSSTYDDTSSLLAIIQQEVSETNGYARMLFNPGTGSYDAGQSRWEEPETTTTVTASGGTIQFDRLYFVAGASSYANRVVSTIDATNNRLEFAASHPFQVNDPVTVTADAGGVVPSALLSGGNPTTLYVRTINNSGTFWITLSATVGGSEIDFGTGTNSIRVRSLKGSSGCYVQIGTTTLNSGQSYNFLTNIRVGGSGTNVNAP